MKACMVLVAFMAVAATSVHATAVSSPISKVFEMLEGLQAKIIKEGEATQKTYDEFSEWCNDRSVNVGFEIKTGKSEVSDLSAAIEKETAKISAFGTKIEELAASISANEGDLNAATSIRKSEAADFAAEEKESKDIISTLSRAIAVINRGGASMMQLKGTESIAQAFTAMVQASVFSSADATRLASFAQTSSDSDEEETGAPSAAAYKSKSGGIVGVMEDLLDKAEAQLEQARKTEDANKNNYAMLKQSLDGEIAAAQGDMADAKTSLAASEEAKATATGDLSVTTADLKDDEATLGGLHQDCMVGAQDFESETKSRGEELTALATAKKILTEALALDQVPSFVQVSQLSSGADLAKFEAVRFIRDLARKEKSVALSQLASKMSSAIRFGATTGADPFAKVKSLISDMIATLEKDAKGEATQKAFCDKEIAETTTKKGEKAHEISKLSTKIDSASANSAKLKEETATLQEELGQIAKSQAEMDKIRSDEKALYETNSAEMKAGINGVKKALSVLRDYYAKAGKSHGASGDSAGGIVSMLEVVESDFTKGLSEMEVAESTAVSEYEKTSTANKFATVSKKKDVEYKGKESASLDKAASEDGSDKDGVQAELDALLEYLAKLGEMCTAKAEPYAERVARRNAEVAGLKEALTILDGEAMLLQKNTRRAFRGKHTRA